MSLTRYRQLLAETLPPSLLREADAALPPEMELQAAWFAGAFGREFKTTDGRAANIVQFGHWNWAAGPDFVDAVVEIDGEPKRGAIELDPTARDWEAHGHAENAAYNKVVLHLFFELPAGGTKYFTRTENHSEVPQVLLDAVAMNSSPQRAEAEARTGRCAAPLERMPTEAVETLLEGAARHRMARKSTAFANYSGIHGRDSALFAGVAEALGFRRNRLPMRVLAGRLPLKTLRQGRGESLLFGAAGFLDEPSYDEAPPETREYLRDLWESWWKVRDHFDPTRAPLWTFAGSRPTNHPHRRLAALALFAKNWSKFNTLAFATPFDPKPLRKFVGQLTHPYWDEHYTLKSKRAEKPSALVGAARVSDLLANVLLPARLPDAPELWPLYREMPAGLGNQKLRRATARLFGTEIERGMELQKSLYAQQAMLQIYDDFCLADESDCDACPFPEQLAQWE